jgi:glycosyltransferase involved in cell wall biosynthesis
MDDMAEQPRKPKVVHLTSVHTASDTRITQKECAALAAEGYEVVVVAPGGSQRLPAGVRHREVPLPANRFERFFCTVACVYRAARDERAAVYHFHDPELVGVGIALRLQGARVVFDVHEDIPADIKTKPWMPRLLRPVASAVATFVLNAVQGWFHAIVPATPAVARTFHHPCTIVVRNYPRIEDIVNGEQKTPLERRPMTALYLGSITELRGVTQIVTAMSDARMPPQARLLLVGEFEDERLRQRVAALPGWDRVDAPGPIARSAVAAVMARARMGLLLFQPAPNHTDAMPTKLFEYMAAGLPAIVSQTLTVCREIVETHGCGIVVDPTDCDAIAAAMCRLFSNPDEAAALGRRGRQAVGGRYEWASEAANLIGLYRKLTA